MATRRMPQTFTVDEFHDLAEQGGFGPTARVELIDGELIWKSPIGWEHADVVDTLSDLFIRQIGAHWRVRVQNPVILSARSEPQPDISVVGKRRYRGAVPNAGHARLVIEVSDTTLFFDVNVKIPLYAAAGVPEAWIIDVRSQTITRYADIEDSRYTRIDLFERGDKITSRAIETLALAVDDIFGSDDDA